MPTLEWIGKAAVLNHHKEIPYCLLHCDESLSVGDAGSGNLLVEGDNLLALKALLPYYAGQVKCIYIDPPYNTGNEGWVYNDNVNSPEMKRWLNATVGSDDLTRHDKWLCMVYPRLALLREFLAEDGLIFVSIDDNEAAHLRCVMDDVFGASNFLASVAWEKRYTRSNNAKLFHSVKDTLVAFRRSSALGLLREKRTDKSLALYRNPDNDPRGPWTSSSYVNPATKAQRPNLVYPLHSPAGVKVEHLTHAWKYERAQHELHVAEDRLWWGQGGTAKYPRLKVFLSESREGIVPIDVWHHAETGTTDEGGLELKAIFGSAVFDNPKPTRLIQRILELCGDGSALVLDSFAGSGTTGHAVLKQNVADGGNRRFILVELEPEISSRITAERLRRVIEGYDDKPGLGGGFRYCRLGEPLFDENGQIRESVQFDELARHVYFTETGEPLPGGTELFTPFIGTHNGTVYYLLFNGILGEKSANGGNVLTGQILKSLAPHDGPRVVFGEGCRLGAERLKRAGVTFRQIPYEIKVS